MFRSPTNNEALLLQEQVLPELCESTQRVRRNLTLVCILTVITQLLLTSTGHLTVITLCSLYFVTITLLIHTLLVNHYFHVKGRIRILKDKDFTVTLCHSVSRNNESLIVEADGLRIAVDSDYDVNESLLLFQLSDYTFYVVKSTSANNRSTYENKSEISPRALSSDGTKYQRSFRASCNGNGYSG